MLSLCQGVAESNGAFSINSKATIISLLFN